VCIPQPDLRALYNLEEIDVDTTPTKLPRKAFGVWAGEEYEAGEHPYEPETLP